MNQQAKEERQRKQQMDESVRRELNKRNKQNANETVNMSKMNAAARQKAAAMETK